jgi:hypothetical protein
LPSTLPSTWSATTACPSSSTPGGRPPARSPPAAGSDPDATPEVDIVALHIDKNQDASEGTASAIQYVFLIAPSAFRMCPFGVKGVICQKELLPRNIWAAFSEALILRPQPGHRRAWVSWRFLRSTCPQGEPGLRGVSRARILHPDPAMLLQTGELPSEEVPPEGTQEAILPGGEVGRTQV